MEAMADPKDPDTVVVTRGEFKEVMASTLTTAFSEVVAATKDDRHKKISVVIDKTGFTCCGGSNRYTGRSVGGIRTLGPVAGEFGMAEGQEDQQHEPGR